MYLLRTEFSLWPSLAIKGRVFK